MRFRFGWALAALVLAVWAAYAPSVGHEFVVDDETYIVDNRAVTGGRPLRDYFVDRSTTAQRQDFTWQSYRPIRTVSFRALVAAFGVKPAPFGVANLLLYGASLVLIALLLRRMCGDEVAAFAGTALFALWPVHVEPVVYASALGDQLSLLFQLLGFFAALRALNAPRRWGLWLALSLLAEALAMGAKEMAVTEGVILAAWVAIEWRRLDQAARLRGVALVATHGALTLGFLIVRTKVIQSVGQGSITMLTAQIAVRAIPLYLWKYLQIIAMPLGHSAAYAMVPLKRWMAALAWLGVIAVALAAWRAKRPALTFALAWYAISLIPVLHVVPLLAFYADRFALVPSLGVALALAVGLAALRGRRRDWALGACALLALVYLGGVLVEERAWKNDVTLWRWAVETQPDAALGHANLAIDLLHDGNPAEALVHLEAVKRISGPGTTTMMHIAMANDMLGRYDEAERATRQLLSRKSEEAEAHALLASLLVRRKQLDEAGREVDEALRLGPDLPSAWMAKAQLAQARGDSKTAMEVFAHAVSRAPTAHYRALYAAAALRAGERAVAAEQARACLAQQPGREDCKALLAAAEAGGATNAPPGPADDARPAAAAEGHGTATPAAGTRP